MAKRAIDEVSLRINGADYHVRDFCKKNGENGETDKIIPKMMSEFIENHFSY